MDMKWFAIMMVGIFGTGMVAAAVSDYDKSQVKIACYNAQAANKNADIKCDK